MCQSEKSEKLLQILREILHAENVKGTFERQWRRKKSYVMKWKL